MSGAERLVLARRFTKLLSSSLGRDKVVKVLQYSIRVMNYFLAQKAKGRPKLEGWSSAFTKCSSALSSARTVNRLGNWVQDSTDIVDSMLDFQQSWTDYGISAVTNALGFVSDICEDINWLGDMKLIPERIGDSAGWLSDASWAGGLVFDIYFALCDFGVLIWSLARGTVDWASSRDKLFWKVADLIKMFSDMVVAATLTFELKTNKGMCSKWECCSELFKNLTWLFAGFYSLCGLLSGIVAAIKLWKKTA
jgi:hypothetical protein